MIAVLCPARGRPQNISTHIVRCMAVAGKAAQWLVISDGDPETARACWRNDVPHLILEERVGYARALAAAMPHVRPTVTHLLHFGNDLLPGCDWLFLALQAYIRAFGDGEGVLGLNDGIHRYRCEQTPHNLISRALLERWYGPACWPVWYDHMFFDTELCTRAREEGRYAVSPWALLYHDHPLTGRAPDATTHQGTAQWEQDRATFERRKASNWQWEP